MTASQAPAKGQTAELKITQEGARRFIVGLSWDPPELPGMKVNVSVRQGDDAISKVSHALFAPFEFIRVLFVSFFNLITMDMYAKKTGKDGDAVGRDKQSEAHDLDLDCYIFDENMNFKVLVGTEDDALIDPSKKVHHSGDDQGGMGGDDDEVVSVETNGLPDDYRHFYFVVKSDSMHDLSQYINPKIRLADGKTNANALALPIGKDGAGKYNYVFCLVSRKTATNGDGDKVDSWSVTAIDEYVGEDMEWETGLPALKAA